MCSRGLICLTFADQGLIVRSHSHEVAPLRPCFLRHFPTRPTESVEIPMCVRAADVRRRAHWGAACADSTGDAATSRPRSAPASEIATSATGSWLPTGPAWSARSAPGSRLGILPTPDAASDPETHLLAGNGP